MLQVWDLQHYEKDTGVFVHMSVAVVAGKFKIHFLTEIKIMKLIIDAFSILMMHLVFSSALPKNLRIHFFVEQTVDKPL